MRNTTPAKLGLMLIVCGVTSFAWADEARQIDVPPGDLVTALESISKQTDVELVFRPEQLRGLRTKGVSGMLSSQEAVRRLLEGTQLQLRTDESTGAMMIGAVEMAPSSAKTGGAAKADSLMRLAHATAAVADAGSPAPAQNPEDKRVAQSSGESADSARFDEVVVTAQKRQERTIDVPMSVSAVSGAVLENLSINNALELSYRVPGLVVQEASPGRQIYTLRGVGNTFGSSPLVGAYLDEVDMTGVSSNQQLDMKLYDLARVEVLHGPQGTLWGAGSVGGTLRFITNAPELDRVGGKLEGTVFGQSRGDASYEVKGAFNMPIVSDVFGVRIAGTYQDWGGWIDQPAAGRRNFNDNRLLNLRARLLWRPTERFEVNGTAIFHRDDGGGKNVVNILPYSRSLFQSFIDPTLDTLFEDDYDHYSLTMSYDFGPLTLLSATGYTQVRNRTWDTRRLDFVADLFPGVPGTNVLLAESNLLTEPKVVTQELRATSGGQGPFNWTIGAFTRREDIPDHNFATNYYGPVVVGINTPTSRKADNESWAVFGDGSYAFNERWKLGAGVRYFHEKRATTDFVARRYSEGNFKDVSPRVYASFAPTGNSNIFLSVAQGFRSGGFNPFGVVAAGGPATFDPENVTSYELGTKMALAGGDLYGEFSVFYNDYSDMQAVGLIPGVIFNVTSNIGKAEIRGFEYSIAWRALDRLTFGLNGSFLHTEVVKLTASQTSQRVGDPLDQVADYNYSVTADYNFNWRVSTPGYFRVSFNEQGPVQWTSRAASLLRPIGHTDTLSFLNVNIGAIIGRTTVELVGRNLLDESGPSSPYGECCLIAPQPRPKQIGVRIAHDFD